jgi:tetratricopeptide (TPR) repeat protein
MSQEFTVQCQNCGTLFPGIHDVCPYCGEPQPLPEPDYGDELPHDDELIDDEASDDEEYLEEADFPPDEPYAEEEDNIFAIAGEEEYEEEEDDDDDDESYEDDEDYYDEEFEDEEYDEIYDDEVYDDEYDELEERPRRVWPRVLLGCLGMLLCVLVFYGGIGMFATYQGLQERTTEIQTRAEDHYQRGQNNLTNDQIELAIAEFEEALRLNPNLLAAREALREAERIVQSKPTPTSETRSAAATQLLEDAENLIAQESWAEAADKLSQVKDLDPDFRPTHVSDLIYQANYQWGLQLITPNQIGQALLAFETALAERPNDVQVLAQKANASLYIEGTTAFGIEDYQTAIDSFSQLYEENNDYLDVQQQLASAYIELGDEYAAEKEWCDAETQYVEAVLLNPIPR